jgi:predicted nucleotidyltransferase
MNEAIRAVLPRLKAGLVQLYGPRLRGVYLFGSVARGEADSESDIDVLIVLDRVENYAAEIQRTSELIGKLSLECGRSISRVFLPEQEWRGDQSMFVLNVREEAVGV